jgi:adenine-specific DNA-methyltransferase
MSNIEHIKAAILARLPEDGSQIGNQKMKTQLAMVDELKLSEEDYRRACEELVAEGQIARGRGRGGAIRLAEEKAEGGSGTGAAPAGSRGKKKKQRDAAGAASAGTPGIGDAAGPYGNYRHDAAAISRPDVGVQAQFNARREPKTYRYDSSLAPELCWDENAEREFAEWLLNLVAEAAEKGEAEVFAKEQVWKGTGDRFASLSQCIARLKSLAQPFLNWAGKAERQQISVPTVPLFVHERHSTETILKTLESHRATGTNLDLFGDETEKDIADRLDAYSHTEEWQNRLVLGDSLQVMNSLLEYEGLGGQVQMIYMDPPYGVKFGSNFQPFVRKRDVKHGRDDEMIREPEMVKAYRDTWQLGLHSYLSYLRDRFLIARELLRESGSIFVQISDENLALVRGVSDEVFGSENFVVTIPVKKTGSQKGNLLQSVNDYLLWYAKDKDKASGYCKNLYELAPVSSDLVDDGFSNLEFADGKIVSLTQLERRERKEKGFYRKNPRRALDDFPGSKLFKADPSTSGNPGKSQARIYEYQGREFDPGISRGLGWKHSAISDNGPSGMDRLAEAGRLYVGKNQIAFKRYHDDFGYRVLTNWWDHIGGPSDPIYAVQTNKKVLERCVLMATDPGDIVLDPTCGSGTTAYVAEQWGRRWITCDASRVPLALARQRLLTATFPWYELEEPRRGPAGGFVYQRKQNRKGEEVGGLVPRITAASIANNDEPQMVTLVDRPEDNRETTRVCGPFTVEATIQAAHSLAAQGASQNSEQAAGYDARTYLDRMIEIVRRSKNLNLPGNRILKLDGVRPVDSEHLHAEAVDERGKRVALMFGPEDGAIHSQQVFDAASEAYFLKYDQLYLFGFAIQAKARELVDDRARLRLPCTYISVNPDVAMDDLLKTNQTDQLFSITGLPDGKLKKAGKADDGTPLYTAEITGLDTFLPDSMKTESLPAENLPCWMLDTNYNGMVFCASQVFFPRTQAWDNLQKSLNGQFNESLWDHLAGTESEPFAAGSNGQVAIKVIDDRGNELMRVFPVEEAE